MFREEFLATSLTCLDAVKEKFGCFWPGKFILRDRSRFAISARIVGMKHRAYLVFLLCVVIGFSFTSEVRSQNRPAPAPYSLRSIRVTSLNQHNNTQKEVAPGDDFWNALGTSLLIVVQVSSDEPDVYQKDRKVEIKAYEGSKLINTYLADTGYFGRNKAFYIPILLHGPFCQEVRVEASIKGQSTNSSISRKVDFACGE